MNNRVLMTNNSSLHRLISSARFVNGSSLDVLIAARDAIHLGGRLLTHPLCGNLRPHQQPFRSVLIEEVQNGGVPGGLVDLDSLSLIEEAVLVYRDCPKRLPLPDEFPAETRQDYAFIDVELMRESLTQYKMWPEVAVKSS
ncbi:MAG: GrdX family protein [Synergistaceae bacterium]|nr:GrdX family protein [Synergistaceae bacterium]